MASILLHLPGVLAAASHGSSGGGADRKRSIGLRAGGAASGLRRPSRHLLVHKQALAAAVLRCAGVAGDAAERGLLHVERPHDPHIERDAHRLPALFAAGGADGPHLVGGPSGWLPRHARPLGGVRGAQQSAGAVHLPRVHLHSGRAQGRQGQVLLLLPAAPPARRHQLGQHPGHQESRRRQGAQQRRPPAVVRLLQQRHLHQVVAAEHRLKQKHR